jgi:phosphate transport system ATP-binding protein
VVSEFKLYRPGAEAESARAAGPARIAVTEPLAKIRSVGLEAGFGSKTVLNGIDLPIPNCRVTAIIGPSGCGKSTFIRCLNRLHEGVRSAWVKGQVLLEDTDVYGPAINPVYLRRRAGMVFQKPNPFPHMTIRENVLAGLRLQGVRPRNPESLVESALHQAALWDEVKDALDRPGTSLSGGQQQRLCIARSLALEPDVLLMDEPCSALDPIATARIEELIHELRERYTIAIVTHNMQQAARVADCTAFFLLGELVEHGRTNQLFMNPADPRTEDYLTGRFG